MNRPPILNTQSIDLSSANEAVTEQTCFLKFAGNVPVEFCFSLTPEVSQVIIDFESGLICNARKLLAARSNLFRRLKGGR